MQKVISTFYRKSSMKNSIILATATLACAAAFAQAPPGVIARPSQETNPITSGGAPAAKAQMKTDAKKGEMPMASGMGGTNSMGMGMKGMDANGDGMVSKKEWQAHHNRMWGKMKSKNGMVPMADIEAMMKAGGPN